MNVLVTGGTGFVGANLARELLADGHRVRVWPGPAATGGRSRGSGGDH